MMRIKDMKAGYGKEPVINIAELVFSPGCVTVIVGKNGSGKSTLLRVMDGQLPYEGSILAQGEEVSSLSRRELACRTAYLPQSLVPAAMTVETLAGHGRFARMRFSHAQSPEDRRVVQEAIARTGLEDLKHRSVDSLSGGERSLAYLAMVIAQQAQILLLDEPTSDLDQPHVQLVSRLLKELAQDGRTVILTCHDLPLAFFLADRVCVLQGGRVGALGSPADLAAQPVLLQDCLGTSLVRSSDEALYPYVLGKGDAR